jgi:hypothetical protein
MSELACRSLDTMIVSQRGDIDTLDLQRDIVLSAQFDTKLSPSIRVGADAVMNVQCGESPLKTWRNEVQKVQQNDGVHSAAQTDEDVAVWWKKRREVLRYGLS